MRIALKSQLCLLLFLLTLVLTHFSGATQSHSISASDLDALVQDNRYPELERQLPLAHLNSTDRTYFKGIVADRSNCTADAIGSLEKVLPKMRRTNSKRAAIALRALAGDYFKTGAMGTRATPTPICSRILRLSSVQ